MSRFIWGPEKKPCCRPTTCLARFQAWLFYQQWDNCWDSFHVGEVGKQHRLGSPPPPRQEQVPDNHMEPATSVSSGLCSAVAPKVTPGRLQDSAHQTPQVSAHYSFSCLTKAAWLQSTIEHSTPAQLWLQCPYQGTSCVEYSKMHPLSPHLPQPHLPYQGISCTGPLAFPACTLFS